MIRSLLILLFGTSKNVPKHDLRKKPTSDDAIKSLNEFLQRNFYIICVLAIIFLLIVFVIVCYALVGVSATDSGTMYNSMEKII